MITLTDQGEPMSKKTPKKLTDKERIFMNNYLVTLRPDLAAREAGYAESTCKTLAYTWISLDKSPKHKRHVAIAIDEAMRKRSQKTELDAEWVLKRLGMIADFNIKKFIRVNKDGFPVYDFSTATDDDWYCISEITIDSIGRGTSEDYIEVDRVKIKPEVKLKALELMGRHVSVQAFKDQIETQIVDKSDILKRARERANDTNR